jgi:hypothetical protein
MHPNHQIIRKLMLEYLRLAKIKDTVEEAGVTVRGLDDINLFDIVLDLVGFPEKPRQLHMQTESGNKIIGFERTKWYIFALELPEKEVDAFLEKLYTEYNELLHEQPELFAENTGKTVL